MAINGKPNGVSSVVCVRLFPVTFCLLALLLVSCSTPFGNSNTSGTAQLTKAPLSKQTFTIPEAGILDFDTLDPALARDPSPLQAVQFLSTGLVSRDHNLHVQPQLARSWHLDTDGVTWTFKLKS